MRRGKFSGTRSLSLSGEHTKQGSRSDKARSERNASHQGAEEAHCHACKYTGRTSINMGIYIYIYIYPGIKTDIYIYIYKGRPTRDGDRSPRGGVVGSLAYRRRGRVRFARSLALLLKGEKKATRYYPHPQNKVDLVSVIQRCWLTTSCSKLK